MLNILSRNKIEYRLLRSTRVGDTRHRHSIINFGTAKFLTLVSTLLQQHNVKHITAVKKVHSNMII